MAKEQKLSRQTKLKQLERVTVLSVPFGAENQGLADEQSDKGDKVVYTLPRWEDFLYGYSHSDEQKTSDGLVKVKDVRDLTTSLYKANPTTLEVLHSNLAEVPIEYLEFYEQLVFMLPELTVMNLPAFYEACMGTFMQHSKGKQTGKSMAHAYRGAKSGVDFHRSAFQDYRSALVCTGKEREMLLDWKRERVPYDEMAVVLEEKRKELVALKDVYRSQLPNEKTHDKLEQLVLDFAKKNVTHAREWRPVLS